MEYVIKKKLVGGERVHYKCRSCAGDLESPLSDAGKQDTFPLCGGTFTVPGAAELQAREAKDVQKRDRAQMETRLRAAQAETQRVDAIRTKAEQRLAENMAGQGTAYEGKLSFEGTYAPKVALLDNERVVDVFETGFWDLCGRKRLVLTTHRLFRSSAAQLDILWLPRVRRVSIGYDLNVVMVAAAVVLLIAIIPVVQNLPRGTGVMAQVILGLLMLTVAALLIVFARQKTMMVSTGEDNIGIKLTRLASDESSRFVNKVFAVLQRVEPE